MGDCNVIVSNIFEKMGIPNTSYDICHFLRDKRQLIVKFKNVRDRDLVWSKRRNLKNSSIFFNEDLPAHIQKQYSTLLIISKEARKLTCYDDVVYFNRKYEYTLVECRLFYIVFLAMGFPEINVSYPILSYI